MKPVIIIAIAFILLIPVSAFAQYMGNVGGEEKIHYNDVHDSMSKHLEAHNVYMEETREGAIEACERKNKEIWSVMTPDGSGTHMAQTLNGTEFWNRECIAWDEHPLIQCGTCERLYEGQCIPLGGLDAQRCRIEFAENNPGCVQKEYHVIDGKCVPPPGSEEDKSTYQPTCAEGDILQNGVCIVTNPQPIHTNENSWFSSIFDWLKSWFQ